MPKDLSKDLNAVQRTPRIRRRLPPVVDGILNTRRAEGCPYRYTTKDVQAIVRYVSERPQIDPRAFTPLDWAAVDDKLARNRAALNQFKQQREQERQRSLLERISGPSLAERISEAQVSATYMPIAPKPVLIDFRKHSLDDLRGIFRPKINATLTRLQPIFEFEQLKDEPYDKRQVVCAGHDRLQLLKKALDDEYAAQWTHEQWQKLDWGLKAIGQVSFKGLRRNYSAIVDQLATIFNGEYFEWFDIEDGPVGAL